MIAISRRAFAAERAGRRRRSTCRTRPTDRAARSVCRVRAKQRASGEPAGAGCADDCAGRVAAGINARAGLGNARAGPGARFRVPGEAYGVREDYAHPLAPAAGHDQVPLAANYQDGHHDDRIHDAQQYDERLHGGDDAEPYYQDDVPLEPHDDEMYDDAPHARRRSGLATALTLIGCAVLGTAGAYAYRSYSGVPSSTQPPPVIAADNSTPTKIVPATAGDPQSSKAMQDRLATVEKEQLVSKQEEPVALSAPRGTPARLRRDRPGLQHSRRPDQSRRRSAPSPFARMEATRAASLSAWRRQRRRDRLRRRQPPRPDRPPRRLHPARRPRPRPRRRADLARTAGRRARCRPRARTAAIPPPAESAANGFVVQLSSQKTESEAQSSFRSLQAKFPNELGSRQPIIRRADLGSKGVFYRTMIGPFASAHEASQFCANYKAAGGQCVVPNN